MTRRLDAIVLRLARPEDRARLHDDPSRRNRLRAVAGIAVRYLWVYLLLLGGSLLWVAAAGMDVYHRTESPRFCNACHEMSANFDTWSESRHGSIKCVDCHATPGVSGWMQAKVAGMAQLYAHVRAKVPADIELGPQHQATVAENCERCHENTARAADRRGRVMAHKRHRDVGVGCVQCHSGDIAHPKPQQVKDPVAGLVDVQTCFACHDGKRRFATTEGPRIAFSAGDERRCNLCHPDARHSEQHGAATTKTGLPAHVAAATRKPCLSCHEAAQRHYKLHDVPQLCARCHEADKTAHVSAHEPFQKGQCGKCHQVMVPAYLFGDGPKPTTAFCTGCHDNLQKALALPNALTLTQFADDELAVMRQSLQTMQAKATKPVQVPKPAPTPDAATLPIAGLHDTLQALVDGAAASAAVDAAVLWLADRRTAATWLVASGVTVNAPGPGFDAAIGTRNHMTAGELAAAGMVVDGVPATRGFVVQRVDVLDRLHGHLWLAMHDDTLLPALQPVIGLVAVQVQGLVERALLLDELGQEQARKNRMLRHLFDAEAEERKHIAREIHDETAQELTALSLLLETASGAEPRPELERAKVLVGEILGGIQRLIRRLRPALLDDLGLCEAISATADSVLKPHGIAFELTVEGRMARLPGEIENALYRVVQEAFTNVVRHADAKHVWLTLHGAPDRVTLRLEDDGKGLPPNAADEAHERPRWGLLGMRERIKQLDGNIAFSARAGGGLTIVLAVPLSPLQEA